MLSRILASDYKHIDVVIPSDVSDLSEFKAKINDLSGSFTNSIQFIQLKYGSNVAETRKQFWSLNDKFFSENWHVFDMMITDINGYEGCIPMICNFNVSMIKGLNRPFIDVNFKADVVSAMKARFTTVLNQPQADAMIEYEPKLQGKVFVHHKVAHELLLPNYGRPKEAFNTLFWPFRISDKAYQFEEFIAAFEAAKLQNTFRIIATDPNDSLKFTKPYLSVMKPSKEEYYQLLTRRLAVVMLDDIDNVLHPGTIEFFHYGCPVVTYKNEMIEHKNMIADLKDLAPVLMSLCYDQVDVSRFVYKRGEIDALYSEKE